MKNPTVASYMIKILRVGECMPSMLVDDPGIACRYWKKVIEKQTWFDGDKETLIVLLLSARMHVQGFSLISVGSVNESIAHPREIFRAAIAGGCYGIIVMHNHPSGAAYPSDTDCHLTRRLSEAADLLQVRLFDHVIVGQPGTPPPRLPPRRGRPSKSLQRFNRRISRRGYYSFKEDGVL